MKKMLALLLSVLLLLSFAGCNDVSWPYGKPAAYKLAYAQSVTTISGMGSLFADCDLVMEVWHNAIHQKRSKTTDKYTMKNGRMTDDFNEALDRLYSDKNFSARLAQYDQWQQELRTFRHDLEEPPKGYEKFNKVLLALVDDHITITCLIIDLKGSYNDVSKEINDLVDRITNNFRELASFQKELEKLTA